MIYQLIFLFLIVIGYRIYSNEPLRNSPSSRKGLIIFVCVILIIQSALRNLAVGSDTYQYLNRFQMTLASSWGDVFNAFIDVYKFGEGKDPGYPLLEKIFQIIFPNYRCWLFAVAIFFFSSLGKFIYRYTSTLEDIFIAFSVYFLLFYSFFSITGIRQTIAVAISLHCFMALRDKKYLIFIMLGIVAFTIHKSAIIILFFPLLNKINNLRFIFIICTILMVIFAANRSYFVMMASESGGYEGGFSIRLPYTLMFFYVIITILIYASVMKNRGRDNIGKRLFYFYLPTYCWIPLMGWDSLFMRESLFFSIYSMVLIPMSIKEITRNNSTVRLIFILLCFSYFLLRCSDYGLIWDEMFLPSYYGRSAIIPFEEQIQ